MSQRLMKLEVGKMHSPGDIFSNIWETKDADILPISHTWSRTGGALLCFVVYGTCRYTA